RRSTALPSTCPSSCRRGGACRRIRPGAASRAPPSSSSWLSSESSYGHRAVAGRLRRTPKDGFGEQRAGRARGDVRRLDVERIVQEVLLPACERHAGLDEPLEHADVVGGPDVARGAQDDRTRETIVAEQELAVCRAIPEHPGDG